MDKKNELIQIVQLGISSELVFQSALALTGIVNRPKDYETLSDTVKRQNFDKKCHDLLLGLTNQKSLSLTKEKEFLMRFQTPFGAYCALKSALKHKTVRETFLKAVANRWGQVITQNGTVYQKQQTTLVSQHKGKEEIIKIQRSKKQKTM